MAFWIWLVTAVGLLVLCVLAAYGFDALRSVAERATGRPVRQRFPTEPVQSYEEFLRYTPTGWRQRISDAGTHERWEILFWITVLVWAVPAVPVIAVVALFRRRGR